jgi:hypothetical protein
MEYPAKIVVYTFDKEIPQGDFFIKVAAYAQSQMMIHQRFSELNERLSGKSGASNVIKGMEGNAAISEAVRWISSITYELESTIVTDPEDNPEFRKFFVFKGTDSFKKKKKSLFGKEKEIDVEVNYSIVYYFWCSC